MSVDVYLIAQIEWKAMMVGQVVAPSQVFKIGYSANPFERVGQLRISSTKNMGLFGVILCRDEDAARATEANCHRLLRAFRGRGEWFRADVSRSWETLRGAYPTAAVWLTDWFDVDLDTMQVVPYPPGAWNGVSDNYRAYRDYKEHGVLSGLFASLAPPIAPIPD